MEARYDGLGRRIVKEVQNSADLNCTYHYYHDSQSVIEVRNGSDLVLKQHVWAPGSVGYVDELVQTALNDDPTVDDDVDQFYWALHNANYNVQALVDDTGVLVERYEYSPYGERQVYFSPGANDPGAHAPTGMSRQWSLSGGGTGAPGNVHPYGLNAIGHQGLAHDEHISIVHNRARTLHPRLGRFIQRDPLDQNESGGGYQDGMSLYAYYASLDGETDPFGLNVTLGAVNYLQDESISYRFEWRISGLKRERPYAQLNIGITDIKTDFSTNWHSHPSDFWNNPQIIIDNHYYTRSIFWTGSYGDRQSLTAPSSPSGLQLFEDVCAFRHIKNITVWELKKYRKFPGWVGNYGLKKLRLPSGGGDLAP